jgi:glycosyltransferase involved in cell wall biosynthesis
MVWGKGFEYLIEAIPTITKTFPKAKILIVGDGPLSERLEALSEELRVRDNVIFAGFRSDIKEILSAIDILVIPSLLEGFPMITLEAMAMAKPIVATNIDGITEQITDEVNGILVPPKNPSALAKASTVIRVLNDKELAMSMGLAAREKVEQEFSVEKMVAETEKVYLSLLKAN